MPQENLSKDQMIFKSYVVVQTLEARIDRHSIEHKEMFDMIWRELKEINNLIYDEIKEVRQEINKFNLSCQAQSERISKLETEKNIWIKILVPIISSITALLTGFLSKRLG